MYLRSECYFEKIMYSFRSGMNRSEFSATLPYLIHPKPVLWPSLYWFRAFVPIFEKVSYKFNADSFRFREFCPPVFSHLLTCLTYLCSFALILRITKYKNEENT